MTKIVEKDNTPLTDGRYATSYAKLAEDEKNVLASQQDAAATHSAIEPNETESPAVILDPPASSPETNNNNKKGTKGNRKSAAQKQKGDRRPAIKLSVEDEDFILRTKSDNNTLGREPIRICI